RAGYDPLPDWILIGEKLLGERLVDHYHGLRLFVVVLAELTALEKRDTKSAEIIRRRHTKIRCRLVCPVHRAAGNLDRDHHSIAPQRKGQYRAGTGDSWQSSKLRQ